MSNKSCVRYAIETNRSSDEVVTLKCCKKNVRMRGCAAQMLQIACKCEVSGVGTIPLGRGGPGTGFIHVVSDIWIQGDVDTL